jgi:glutamate carboxypeptidase
MHYLQDLLNHIQTQQPTLITQLIQWCEINSGSTHLQGLNTMHQCLLDAFAPLADETQRLIFPPLTKLSLKGETIFQAVGNGLLCRKRPALKRRVLLCGHMDTVYPEASAFQKTTFLDENRLNGPGVADMKGGLLIMLTALQAFEKCPAAKTLGWDVFINADEELGSLASGQALMEISKQAQVALVFEPALDEQGTLARKRKGNGHFVVLAKGKTAHAGRNFDQGRNAITLLARALVAMDALNGQRPGVTINIALIEGGSVLNQVPAEAGAKLEIRCGDPSDETWIMEKLWSICQSLSENEATLRVEGKFHRPCKTIFPATQRLFDSTQALAKTLGLSLDWQDTGGCCDGNNLSHAALAVLDNLGARGGKIHTPEEFICLDSLAERAKLTACLLEHLALGGLEALYL